MLYNTYPLPYFHNFNKQYICSEKEKKINFIEDIYTS